MEFDLPLRELWSNTTEEELRIVYRPVLKRVLQLEFGVLSDLIDALVERSIASAITLKNSVRDEIEWLAVLAECATKAMPDWVPSDVDGILQHIVCYRFQQIRRGFQYLISQAEAKGLQDKAALLREKYGRVVALEGKWLLDNLSDERGEEPPDPLPIGARPRPPVMPRNPGMKRTFWEADQLPRNP